MTEIVTQSLLGSLANKLTRKNSQEVFHFLCTLQMYVFIVCTLEI